MATEWRRMATQRALSRLRVTCGTMSVPVQLSACAVTREERVGRAPRQLCLLGLGSDRLGGRFLPLRLFRRDCSAVRAVSSVYTCERCPPQRSASRAPE